MSIQEYARLYNISERTVHRYKKCGFPLDDEKIMRAAIADNRSRYGVSKFRSKLPTLPELQQLPELPKFAPSEDVARVIDETIEMPDGEGLAATIQRFRAAEKAIAEAYGRNPKPALLQSWTMITEQLRKIEKDHPEIARTNNQLLDKDEVEAQWSQGFAAFRSALDAIPNRMAKMLEGLDSVTIRERLKEEVNLTLSILQDPERMRTEEPPLLTPEDIELDLE